MDALVLREDQGGLVRLTLNRPDKMNALSMELFGELDEIITSIESDPGVRAVLLRGAGRCFSAGHDLEGIAAGENHARANFQAHVIERLGNLLVPVIAGVHGVCYTGALELVLASDMIVAAASARFADTHARFALSPLWGMSQRLPRRVGAYKAREMMFTCRAYSADEAVAMGLANLAVPDAEFDAACDGLCATVLAQSPHSHRANKRMILDTDGMPQPLGLAYEIYNSPGRGPDFRDRITAFQTRKR